MTEGGFKDTLTGRVGVSIVSRLGDPGRTDSGIGQTRRVRWWRALNTPRGVFWSRVVSALLMLVFGVLVLVFGDEGKQITGACALLIALINAAMAIGQWPELKASEDPADRELPS